MMEKLNALSGNYEPGSDDFDKGKVAFLPMTLAQRLKHKLIKKRSQLSRHGHVVPRSSLASLATQLLCMMDVSMFQFTFKKIW